MDSLPDALSLDYYTIDKTKDREAFKKVKSFAPLTPEQAAGLVYFEFKDKNNQQVLKALFIIVPMSSVYTIKLEDSTGNLLGYAIPEKKPLLDMEPTKWNIYQVEQDNEKLVGIIRVKTAQVFQGGNAAAIGSTLVTKVTNLQIEWPETKVVARFSIKGSKFDLIDLENRTISRLTIKIGLLSSTYILEVFDHSTLNPLVVLMSALVK